MNISDRRTLPRLAAASVGALIALPALSGGVALAAPAESGKSPAASSQPRAESKNAESKKSSSSAKPKPSKSAKPKPSKSAKPAGDPAGNNGTIKIQPFGGVAGNSNTPHPGCDFRLQMFNFDANQTGTITFAGQAPTAGAVTSQPLAGTQLLSDDAAGGGQDRDAFYDVRGSSLGLTGAPGPKGYHVKVLVDADDAPGGAKQKVFWLDCPVSTPSAPAESGGEGAGELAPSAPAATGGSGAGELAPSQLPFTTNEFTGGSGTTSSLDSSQSSASRSSGAAGGSGSTAATAAGASEPAAESRPIGALPFTGVELGLLVTVALGALGTGAYFLYAGRRQSA